VIELDMAWGLVKLLAAVIGILLAVSVMTAAVESKREHERKDRRR
jgi:uncharacterized integral membrane protein